MLFFLKQVAEWAVKRANKFDVVQIYHYIQQQKNDYPLLMRTDKNCKNRSLAYNK